MIGEACDETLTAGNASPEFAMMRVVEAARVFLSYRDRMTAMGVNLSSPSRSLADAIDRDFLFFDFERSVQALREAVAAVPDTGLPEVRERPRRPRGVAA
jgi:hypothetical protein